MIQFVKIAVLTILLVVFCDCNCIGQTDTAIGTNTYRIIERHENGNLKLIGQFGWGDPSDQLKKHGSFVRFNKRGKEIKRKLYFFDERRNRKLFGLKHGWWGWYGITTKYFLGIRVTKPVIVDPSF